VIKWNITESGAKHHNPNLVQFVHISLLSFVSASDQACKDIGGTCQDDHTKCHGSYYSGKCTGGHTNRCCSPSTVGNVFNTFYLRSILCLLFDYNVRVWS
jgi:hypothetical protein